jgi:hypothetical protein
MPAVLPIRATGVVDVLTAIRVQACVDQQTFSDRLAAVWGRALRSAHPTETVLQTEEVVVAALDLATTLGGIDARTILRLPLPSQYRAAD